MRTVRRYHATTATAPTVRAVACHAGAMALRVSIRYPTTSSVVTMATRRPIRDAFRATSLMHFAHTSPNAIPGVISPQRAQGWLDPVGHSPSELCCGSTAPQILGPDVVLHDHRLQRAAQPARFLEPADVVQHHRRREHLRGGVRDALPGDIGRRAVDRLEDRRVLAHVRARREPQPSYQARGLVREDVAEQVGGDYHVELRWVDPPMYSSYVHDLVIRGDLPLVFGGDVLRGLEK